MNDIYKERERALGRKPGRFAHYCVEWDFMFIDEDSPEFEACLCQIDHDGKGPMFRPGDIVKVLPYALAKATVVKQMLSYDYPDVFWGNVEVIMNEGPFAGHTIICNNWQLEPLATTQGSTKGVRVIVPIRGD